MKISRIELLADLKHRTEAACELVRRFKSLGTEELNYRESPDRWSILECIEHLNLYGDYYLPEIERRILQHKPAPGATEFRSGLLGNYFANLMLVDKNGKLTTMKSPADKNPSGSKLSITTLDRFLKQQDRLKALLRQAQQSDLTNIKVSISLTRFVKLRLGDTFRFFIYHIDRHVRQAERVLQAQRATHPASK